MFSVSLDISFTGFFSCVLAYFTETAVLFLLEFLDQGRAYNMFDTKNLDPILNHLRSKKGHVSSEIELDSSRKMSSSQLKILQAEPSSSSNKHTNTITRSSNVPRFKADDVSADFIVKQQHLFSKFNDEGASSSTQAVERCGMITSHHPKAKAACNSNFSKGKVVLQASEAEEINRRLEILEEENEILKQAFLETVEERENLVNEIGQLFHSLSYSFHHDDQEDGRYGNGILTITRTNSISMAQ